MMFAVKNAFVYYSFFEPLFGFVAAYSSPYFAPYAQINIAELLRKRKVSIIKKAATSSNAAASSFYLML